jgi:hypothetical protein
MGVLSDVFIGDRAEASSVVEHGPSGILPTFQAKSLDPVLLGKLEAEVTGTPYERLRHELAPDHIESDGGDSGVVAVRASLVAALGTIGDEQIPALAEAWSKAEEWFRATGTDLEPIVAGLRAIAVEALRDAKGLWVWWSI